MRIAYVQYTNPGGYPPLEHSSRILAGRGWNVLFLGTSAFGSAVLQLPPHPMITVRLMQYCPPGMRQKLHYLRFCAWVLFTAISYRTKWIYASDPFSCPVALLLSYIPGMRVLYHEHDSPAETAEGGFAGIILRCRRALVRRARMCILPNELRAASFKAQLGPQAKVITVWNCPSREEVSGRRQDSGGETIWLLYHGSITEERLPLSTIHALAELPDFVKLRVVGYETIGSRGYVERIKEFGQKRGIAHRLEFPGTLPLRSDILEFCRRSDIGLALMPADSKDLNMRAMVGASNKAFDYLACGLALMVSDLPDWRRVFVDSGYGVACRAEDGASVTEVLRALISDPARMRAMGERGRQRIEREWNYERQFEPVLAAMEA